jgi:hypothetical protein
MQILILPDDKPKNPCERCAASPKNDPQAYDGCDAADSCIDYRIYGRKVASILSQCKEINLNKVYGEYSDYIARINYTNNYRSEHNHMGTAKLIKALNFEQFIQEQDDKGV